jgi:hypothetical protein
MGESTSRNPDCHSTRCCMHLAGLAKLGQFIITAGTINGTYIRPGMEPLYHHRHAHLHRLFRLHRLSAKFAAYARADGSMMEGACKRFPYLLFSRPPHSAQFAMARFSLPLSSSLLVAKSARSLCSPTTLYPPFPFRNTNVSNFAFIAMIDVYTTQ